MTETPDTPAATPKKGTKQTTAEDSDLGQTPTSEPQEGGPEHPKHSPYAE